MASTLESELLKLLESNDVIRVVTQLKVPIAIANWQLWMMSQNGATFV
jgi:hypothetical protein